MNTQNFEQFDLDDEVNESQEVIPEPSLSTKLERRRRIEELFEEKRLREELEEFGY